MEQKHFSQVKALNLHFVEGFKHIFFNLRITPLVLDSYFKDLFFVFIGGFVEAKHVGVIDFEILAFLETVED